MKTTRFERVRGLLVVEGWILTPGKNSHRLRLAVDTGAGMTLILPEILNAVGFSVRQGEARTIIRSAVAEEPGYTLRVPRFRALGHELTDFRIHAHDLPDGFGIDGLLGLDFLDLFNYEIRSLEGRILAARV